MSDLSTEPPAPIRVSIRSSTLLWVFLAALAVRLWFCFVAVPQFGIASGPQAQDFHTSSDGYLELARNLADHDTFAFGAGASPTTYRAPAYPFVLAGAYRLVGRMEYAVLVVNCLASALSAVIALLITSRFIPAAHRLTAYAVVLMPWSVWYCASSFSDTFLAFTILAYVLLLVRMLQIQSVSSGIVAAVAFAATVLTKAILLPFPFLLLMYALFFRRALLRSTLASLLVGIILVGTWTYRNFRVSGEFIPVSQGMGFNLLTGTYMIEVASDAESSFKHGVVRTLEELTRVTGRPHTQDDLRPEGHFDIPTEMDKLCGRLAIAQFRENPGLLIRKLFWNSIRFWYFASTPERGSLAMLFNVPLVVVGLLGLIRYRHNNDGAFAVLLLFMVFFVGTYALIIVSGPRLCLPILMLLAPFAGQAVAEAWIGDGTARERARERQLARERIKKPEQGTV